MSLLTNRASCLLLVVFFCLPIVNAHSSEIEPGQMARPGQMMTQTPFPKPPSWGNDVLIAPGTVSGGISVTYDSSGNMYAARCSTYNDTARYSVRIYRSTDDGYTWQPFKFFISAGGYSFFYPKLLVCQKADSNYLYLLYWRSDLNGRVRLGRWKLDGAGSPSWYDVVSGGPDIAITYFSACSNLNGDTLFVAYEEDVVGDPYPNIRFIISTNYGTTWSSDTQVDMDGAQPDIAYGADGRLFLAVQDIDPEHDIQLWFSTNYGAGWVDKGMLTGAGADESYPKVGALHTSPANTARIWVVYNHHVSSTNKDLMYAYSTDGGSTWSPNQVIANSGDYDEMATDLEVYRTPSCNVVDLCYLKSTVDKAPPLTYDIYYTWAYSSSPQFHSPPEKMNDTYSYSASDGREVCQVIFQSGGLPGVVYAGVHLLKNGAGYLYDGAWNLYYDYYNWVDVEEENPEKELPSEFSLSANYPNPFNPETKIAYSIPRRCRVKLEVFNILGQKIRTLVDEEQSAGKREVTWNGKDENDNEVASGVYFYKLQAKDLVQTKKMVLIR
jgi:hypothetical protein